MSDSNEVVEFFVDESKLTIKGDNKKLERVRLLFFKHGMQVEEDGVVSCCLCNNEMGIVWRDNAGVFKCTGCGIERGNLPTNPQ